MKEFLLFALLTAIASTEIFGQVPETRQGEQDPQIIGGVDAVAEEFPFVAKIIYSGVRSDVPAH